ncbi:MAG: hypothetical protein LBJ01_05480 [Tannerella sp.]|nr:hypothetical protein [Tannerella sp.]
MRTAKRVTFAEIAGSPARESEIDGLNYNISLRTFQRDVIEVFESKRFAEEIKASYKCASEKSMIYGVDFQEQYDDYVKKRSIKRKLECSINDWMLNWEMLKIKYKDIHEENYLLKNLLFDRIMGENVEATVDIKL